MATKSIELLLELVVKGGGDVGAIEQAISELVKEAQKLKSIAQLKDILGADKAVGGVQALQNALVKMKTQLFEVADEARFLFSSLAKMQAFKLDIDLGKVENSLTTIAHEANATYQTLLKLNKGKLDFDTSQANKDLDLLLQKGRQLIDLPLTTRKAPLDLNLEPAKKSMDGAKRSADSLRTSLGTLSRESQKNSEHFRLLNTQLGTVASNFLFLRRVVIAVFGVNLADRILETVKAFDRLDLSLKAVFQNNAANELQFVRANADRLGISVTELGSAWSKFAASVDQSKVSMEVMRDNFLAVAEAGSRLGLSTEEINGALTALSQIASKGRLSMEELRQQLGDRLPGAVRIAADALGLTQAKLFALIEQGKISSDVFLNAFPAALRKSFGTDQSTRIDTVGAAVQRLQNALTELINAAVRSGALDVFIRVVNDLAKAFQDKAFVERIQEIANGIAKFAVAAIGAAKPLAVLLAAILAFKAISGVNSLINGFTQSLIGLASSLTKVGGSVGGIGPSVATFTSSAAGATTATTGWTAALTSFGATLVKVATSVGVLTAVYVAGKFAADAFVDSLIAGQQAAGRLADAQREAASNTRVADLFQKQAEELKKFADVSVLTTTQINALSKEQAALYSQGVQGATELAAAQEKQAAASIKAAQEQIKAIQLSGDTSAEARKKIDELLFTISALRDRQAEAAQRSAELARVLVDIEQRGSTAASRLNDATKSLEAFAGEAAKSAKIGDSLEKLELSNIVKQTKEIITGFIAAREKGEDFGKALDKAIPKDWLEGGVSNIAAVGNALGVLTNQGLIPASQAADELAKDLSKLSSDKISEFGINAQFAFDSAKLSAEGLGVILEGSLRANLQKLGVDAEFAGTRVSKQFNEMNSTFVNLASNVRATGAQIKESLDVTIAAAKTREELVLIQSSIEALGLSTGKFAQELQDSFTRLDDKIRLTTGILNSALGDSFARLGIQTKAQLTAIADQAQIDFTRIKNSGMATAQELEAAFRKMAEEITNATQNGIPPIKLRFDAINNNAFDILVKTAETAGLKVKKAIEDAIPLADTLEKLRVLREGIQTSFELGKLSVADFGEEMTKVGFAIREALAKPVGEVAAVVETFGFKTKDQLKAISDNSKEAFDIMRTSGEFTTGELVKAAQQYLDAYKAANDGVVDTFDPVIQKALEVVNSVEQVGKKVDEIKGIGSDPIAIGNLRDKNIPELQQEMADLSKAFRAIGIQNVQDLQIIQAIQKELNRQAAIDAEARKKMFEEQTALMNQAADNVADRTLELSQVGKEPAKPIGGSLPGKTGFNPKAALQGDTFNINLNGGNGLTTDDIKRKVIPAIRQRQLRTR